ncbi:hypothetical protein ACKKBF_B02030 [Auxenochlorella protothecoides x Auxenochlorella symbiontica]
MESACLTRPGASPKLAKPWYARDFVPCSPLRTEEVPCLPGRALKVLTYNILADCLTTRMRSEYDAAVLDPVRRVALLMAGLQALDADLYFLQEVEEGLMETLREMMSGHERRCIAPLRMHYTAASAWGSACSGDVPVCSLSPALSSDWTPSCWSQATPRPLR